MAPKATSALPLSRLFLAFPHLFLALLFPPFFFPPFFPLPSGLRRHFVPRASGLAPVTFPGLRAFRISGFVPKSNIFLKVIPNFFVIFLRFFRIWRRQLRDFVAFSAWF